ncbi:MAG: hypothetical protein ACK5KO_09195 [Arachnia sp.]
MWLLLVASACSGAEAEPTSISLEITSTAPAQPQLEQVPLGSEVTLTVTSDAATQVHVHGYEMVADVTPGEPVELSFVANMSGVYEIETHPDSIIWARLEVG